MWPFATGLGKLTPPVALLPGDIHRHRQVDAAGFSVREQRHYVDRCRVDLDVLPRRGCRDGPRAALMPVGLGAVRGGFARGQSTPVVGGEDPSHGPVGWQRDVLVAVAPRKV